MYNSYLQPYDYTGMHKRVISHATQGPTIPDTSPLVLAVPEAPGVQGIPSVPAASGTPVIPLMQLDGAIPETWNNAIPETWDNMQAGFQQGIPSGTLVGIQPGMQPGMQHLMCPKFGRRGRSAMARIRGGPLAPEIQGVVYFIDVPGGTAVYVYVTGLPPYQPASNGKQPVGPHGFHIHEFGNCQVDNHEDPFNKAGQHWNPTNQPHGNHAGDFPVLFSNNGLAVMSFFTNKFKPMDVAGKSVIIHENPDDYRTQPSGNAGKRLACGVIQML